MNERYPLSFAQQRLWFLSQSQEGTGWAYTFPAAIYLTGHLNIAALESAVQSCTARQETLRTSFRAEDGEPYQTICEQVETVIRIHDRTRVHETLRQQAIEEFATALSQEAFELEKGPLFRLSLLRFSETENVLFFTVHHIIWDAWSWSVFWRELADFYNANCRARIPQISPLPGRYIDHVVQERERVREGALFSEESYWRAQFSKDIPVLDLPADRSRPAKQSYRGSAVRTMLDKQLSQSLKNLALRTRTSPFIVMLAAYAVLLLRYTGQEDLIVGSPLAGRNERKFHPLIGLFVNTLALRINLSGNPTVKELLHRVREVVLGAYANQAYPFEKLVEIVNPERDESRTPLFQVMFMFRDVKVRGDEFEGLKASLIELDKTSSKFDLTASVSTAADCWSMEFEYSTDLFEPKTIARMLNHYEMILRSIVNETGQKLSDVRLLSDPEVHALLRELNNTQAELPAARTLHKLFDEQVERTPNRTAVIGQGQNLTYTELNRQANQLAHFLRKLGAKIETRVGIYLNRSPEMVIALLGTLKAGAAFVPLDPGYPLERLRFMLSDAKVEIVLTEGKLEAALNDGAASTVYLDRDWPRIAGESSETPSSSTAEDLAYVLYTSGSTGTPKGVLGRHQGAINRCVWMWEEYPFEEAEVCSQKTSLNFVDSIWEIFGPLLRGVPLTIIPDDVLINPHAFVETLNERGVTRLTVVPSLLRLLVESFPDLQERLPRLKLWISSGEALQVELLEAFRKSMPKAVLLNLYGMSEGAGDSTSYDTSNYESGQSVTIGRPIFNTSVYILDSYYQLLPVGVPGELYIGGVGLARAYQGRPDLTSERFIPHPFAAYPGERLYRTGDAARYLPDGNIEFMGRLDDQVKVHGQRIEPREIEALLRKHPSVKEALVIAGGDESPEGHLAAYLVLKGESKPLPSELQRFLEEWLPLRMIPSSIFIMDAFPLLPNGKVNRRELPERIKQRKPARLIVPRTPTEATIAEVWRELLGVDEISVGARFFDLGGYSLLAMKAVARLEQRLGVRLDPMKMLLKTIESLAQICEQELNGRQPVQ